MIDSGKKRGEIMGARKNLEEARKIDAWLRRLQKLDNRVQAKKAELLLRMKRRKLYASLGFSSVYDYASAALGMAKRTARELVEIAERLGALPKIAAAFKAGE